MYTAWERIWNLSRSKVRPQRPATLGANRMSLTMADEKAETRAERLKAALRANLRRRKAQERGRADGERPEPAESPRPRRDDATQDG